MKPLEPAGCAARCAPSSTASTFEDDAWRPVTVGAPGASAMADRAGGRPHGVAPPAARKGVDDPADVQERLIVERLADLRTPS